MRRPIIVAFFSFALMACQVLAAERGALFKVSGHGHTLYLYGTIHAGKPDYYPLEPHIAKAVAAAPTLALEVDTARDPGAVQAAFARHGVFAAGSPGYAGLPGERRRRLEAALKQQGVDLAAVMQLKPWMLATMLTVRDLARLGYDPAFGVDAHLAGLARGKARIAELESSEYQAALLDRLPLAMQWDLLEETLAHMASGRQLREARELFEAYERADRQALERIAARIDSDDSVSGKFVREIVLDERNGPMAERLAALLARDDNAVAAIGLMHLLGKGGVPVLLRQRGMQVERIY
ncbi:TraB/GumN family protein [Massilia jejuensis]|uniref:TraB/GumN family protein n=1 Tax=Massilia jejuensis TaxID=648894 RepID=A0ABW0PFN4_9BURK